MKLKANEYTEKDVLKILRQWTGLTQEEFAKSVGRTYRVIRSYERGATNYSFKTLKEICEIHGIEITFEKKEK